MTLTRAEQPAAAGAVKAWRQRRGAGGAEGQEVKHNRLRQNTQSIMLKLLRNRRSSATEFFLRLILDREIPPRRESGEGFFPVKEGFCPVFPILLPRQERMAAIFHVAEEKDWKKKTRYSFRLDRARPTGLRQAAEDAGYDNLPTEYRHLHRAILPGHKS